MFVVFFVTKISHFESVGLYKLLTNLLTLLRLSTIFCGQYFFVEAALPVLVFDILLQVLFCRKCLLFHDSEHSSKQMCRMMKNDQTKSRDVALPNFGYFLGI